MLRFIHVWFILAGQNTRRARQLLNDLKSSRFGQPCLSALWVCLSTSRFLAVGSSQKSSEAFGETARRPAQLCGNGSRAVFAIFVEQAGEVPKAVGSWWVIDLEVEKYLKREASL